MSTQLLGTLGVKLDALTADFERNMAKAQSKLEGIASTAKKVAMASGAAFAGMAVGITAAVRASSEQREAELRLGAAIRGTGAAIDPKKIKAYASELQKVTTFGDEATISAAAMLTTFQLNESQIMNMLPRVQNLAAMYGMDLTTAAVAVGKTLTGSAGALSRYGIVLSEAEKDAFNLADATERVGMMMKFLDVNTGPAAEALAKTATGAVAQLMNSLSDLLQEFGFMIDMPITTAIGAVIDVVSRLTGFIGKLSPATKSWIAIVILGTTALFGITAAISGVVALLPIMIGLLTSGAVAMAGVFFPVTIAILAVLAVIIQAVFWVSVLRKAWRDNLFGIRGHIEWLVDNAKIGWKAIADTFGKAWGWQKNVVKEALSTMGSWIESWVNANVTALRTIGKVLKIDSLAGLKDIKIDLALEDTKSKALEFGKTVFKSIEDGGKAAGGFLNDALKESWEDARGVVQPLVDAVADLAKSIIPVPPPPPPTPPPPPPPTPPPTPPGAGVGGAGVGVAKPAAIPPAGEIVAGVSRGLGGFGRVIEMLITKGPIAAIIGIVAEALATTKTFGKILVVFGQFLANIGRALEPVMNAVFPLIGILLKLAAVFFHLFFALNPFIIIVTMLTPLISLVAEAMRSLLTGFINFVNGILEFIKNLFGKLLSGKALRSFRALIDSMKLNIRPDAAAPEDPAGSINDFNSGLDNAGAGLDDFGGAMRDVNEQLNNVPEGFRVVAERFKAMEVEPGSVGEVGGVGAMRSTIGTNIESVVIQALDPDEAWEGLKNAAERDNFLGGGTIIGQAARLAVEGEGA